jgi:dTDP-4-amino-4,6-dideoxygalactose transaminase
VGQVEIPGVNAKMSEYHAAIGLANLAKWPSLSAARIELFGRYSARLDALTGLAPAWQKVPAGIVRTLLCFRVRTGGLREAIEVACAAAGIETRRWYLPTLNRHDAFAELPRAGTLHESDQLCEELVGLPFHAHLAPPHIDAIVRAVSSAVGPAN